jgi:transcriptional regulator with XRE-family HTH domain
MSFGEMLKQYRLERGWTKEYISERTNLMTSKIDAIEAEALTKLPAGPYVKGWIKKYCEILEIDDQPLVAAYEAQIAGKHGKSKSVTRPEVRELPARPLEPIHTGAKRTLPPQGPEPVEPTEPMVHKIVEPASETFTSVPIPEVMPHADDLPLASAPAPEVAPAPAEAFTLSSDPLPQSAGVPLAETPAPAPVAHPHRAIFTKDFEKEKRERKIVQQRDLSEDLRPRGADMHNIFSPQKPVSDPSKQTFNSILDLFKQIGKGCTSIVTRATRPKVTRLHGDEGRYVTPRMLYQALLVFIVLLGLTALIFIFRYIFRLSDAAEPEYGINPGVPSTQFELRPVANPPAPFFD